MVEKCMKCTENRDTIQRNLVEMCQRILTVRMVKWLGHVHSVLGEVRRWAGWGEKGCLSHICMSVRVLNNHVDW